MQKELTKKQKLSAITYMRYKLEKNQVQGYKFFALCDYLDGHLLDIHNMAWPEEGFFDHKT